MSRLDSHILLIKNEFLCHIIFLLRQLIMFKNKNFSGLKDSIKSYIEDNKIYKKYPNTKYSLDLLLDVIIYVMETGISWRSLNSP